MKVYTRKGDKGSTSLLGGMRVSKADIRIEAYGTVDELNAYVGLLADYEENRGRKGFLNSIQDHLFIIGSMLAVQPGKSLDYVPGLEDTQVSDLEEAIDSMDSELPEMRNFVLPGGHPLVSFTHIARCVCRRAERAVALLMDKEDIDDIVLKYLNRLSDYLFVLSRKVASELRVQEKTWRPREKHK